MLAEAKSNGTAHAPSSTMFAPRPLETLIREGRTTFHPELAARVLAEANYGRQRGVKPFRLHRHVSTIKRGQWDGDFSIRFCLLNGKLILVDGQHRLWAVCETGETVSILVVISKVKTLAEVHRAYARTDVDGNRSVADVLNAADPTAGRDVSSEMRRAAYHAMDALANDFPHRRLGVGENELVTKEDRVDCMAFWMDEIEAFDQIVQKSQGSLRARMRNPGIVAVALATLRHQRPRAEVFWTTTGENNLLKHGDPEQALVNFLLTASFVDGYRIPERGASSAWNSWFAGRRLGGVKKNGSGKIKISGTPYQGRD